MGSSLTSESPSHASWSGTHGRPRERTEDVRPDDRDHVNRGTWTKHRNSRIRVYMVFTTPESARVVGRCPTYRPVP
eukprot:1367871-Prymnesium_polylepis.1